MFSDWTGDRWPRDSGNFSPQTERNMAPLPALSSLLDRSISTASAYLSILARVSALFSLLDALSSQLTDVLAFHGPEPFAGQLDISDEFPDLTESVAGRLRERLEGAMAELHGLALPSPDALETRDSDDALVSVPPTDIFGTPARTKKRELAPPVTFPALLTALYSQMAQLGRLSNLPGSTTHLDPLDTFGYSSRDCVEWIGELVSLCSEGIAERMERVGLLKLADSGLGNEKKERIVTLEGIQENWDDGFVRDLLARIRERTALAKAAREAG
jgi:hypothetical protein